MKKYLPIYSLLLLLVFVASCKEETKTKLPVDSISEAESSLPDRDPYFVESEAQTTSFGPSSITRNILQDKKGNIWLATWEGIIRFDGTSFTNFTNKEGLKRFRVFSVLEDENGNIWFGTIGAGVYRFDGKLFTNFTTKDGLAHNGVGCIYEDNSGNIWFGTGGGASRYDGKSFRNITTEDGLTNNDINSIIEDQTGKFWFGTRGGTCTYDGKIFSNFTNKTGAPFVNVRSIIEDTKGNIWFGGNDGLWRYDSHSLTNFTTDFVGYIYEDKKGNIWTNSASHGNSHNWVLSRYDEESLQTEKATATQVLAKKGMFFGIMEDTEGHIWLGTLNGVYRYDGETFYGFTQGP
jgi:ligand-binding sensor domain-containing protein